MERYIRWNVFGKEENVIPFEVFFFFSPLPGYCSIWRKILIGFSSQMESENCPLREDWMCVPIP